MDLELERLLALATDAFAEHGSSGICYVVHEVDADNRIIDHNESPEGCFTQSDASGLVNVDGRHFSASVWRPMGTDLAMKSWLAVAQACGAWCLPRRMLTLTPLPGPVELWGIELLGLPKSVRQYQKSMWFCNAFGANVVMLRLIAAGKETEILPETSMSPTLGLVGGQALKEAKLPTAPPDGPRKADESLRLGYSDPGNYWRNVWLYEQRAAEKTNNVILEELKTKAMEYEPLYSENALRNAVESIAEYHGWPVIKGKTGRPRST